ncbi:hypothetical protein JIR001_06040 [Polycladomyces abyssicola]|uniref:Uncharacterized protein n=1 Tax=Polycladomyces abyssicola TaxID=1125966 RepID=A0A8D5ZMX9_9BACL|nr:hypothetical protein [Polycladomyces abyssicola]BCU80821.1 hypothetical protein JIR001_06040 [Polycladomyces abyssicola]
MAITKEDLYKLIDQLNEAKIPFAYDFLKYLIQQDNPFKVYENMPADPLPMNDEEREQWEKKNEGELTSLKRLKKELGL